LKSRFPFNLALSETVGDALKSAAKAFSAGDAKGDKAGEVGGKFRSDGEVGGQFEDAGEFRYVGPVSPQEDQCIDFYL
jgi:hypothetical protein